MSLSESQPTRVLIFGDQIIGNQVALESRLRLENCDFDCLTEIQGLSMDYDLIILKYETPLGNVKKQEILQKRVQEALRSGRVIVFLHYEEKAQNEKIESLLSKQIGYNLLFPIVWAENVGHPIYSGKLSRPEFSGYFERWGASRLVFKPDPTMVKLVEDRILEAIGIGLIAFTIKVENGLAIYLPCQLESTDPETVAPMLLELTKSALTYLAFLRGRIPDWAEEPLSEEEKNLGTSLQAAKEKVAELESQLQPFREAKALAFKAQYEFEKHLPRFLKKRLGLRVEKTETFQEDFWLLDSGGKKIAVCEAKSSARGLKRSGVFQAHNHRESQGLEPDFPAILFVNQNLHATGWNTKSIPIPPQLRKTASENGVLIARVEDLLNLWVALRQRSITVEEIQRLLTEESGWLQCKPDGTRKILK